MVTRRICEQAVPLLTIIECCLCATEEQETAFEFNSSAPADEAAVAAAQSDESVVDRSYVKKKLEHGLTRIWQVIFCPFLKNK